MRYGTAHIGTEDLFERFILNREVFWFPQIIDGFDMEVSEEIPPLWELLKGLMGFRGVKIARHYHVPGVPNKMVQQFLTIINAVKEEEKREIDKAKREMKHGRR